LEKEKLQELLYGIYFENNTKAENSAKKIKKTDFNGLIPNLRNLYNEAFSVVQQRELNDYRKKEVCQECGGSRLKKESLAVKIYGNSINDVVTKDIQSCLNFFIELEKKFNNREKQVGDLIIKEITDRLNFLINVGLPYFSLNRTVGSLSGGEAQRIRLASQIGSQLVGITYVLDEPSIGLHQHDNNKLIDSLKQLRDLGNSIVVVEHDKTMIEEADYIVDIGPGAGIHGGEILFASKADNLAKLSAATKEKSLTYQYLKNVKKIVPPEKYREPNPDKMLVLKGATGHNLQNVDLKIPLGLFVCVTGMSGSGKSTLINDTLFPILSNKLHRSLLNPLKYKEITGIELIDKVIEIDQKPIGRTPRSNPATYTKMFDIIRNHFANLTESSIRGYKAGRFSFNVKGGRCEECEGAGIKKLEMNFLPDVYVTCEICNGKRYNEETLQVKFKGKNISDVLNMTVEEALEFFENMPKLKNKLEILNNVGLGYVKLGQQATTLSGGEAQRIKLSTELARPSTGKTIYLLDEPTTGLHFEDIRLLLILLQSLVDKGNTIIVIEHNFDVIKCADWIIDLGPEGGDKGGKIVAEGNPLQIIKNPKTITGKYLKKEM
jgi:excinuclease ABC subunit A